MTAVDFRAEQARFAAYIRDPEQIDPPAGVDPVRMAMYRELFFNNINSFLCSNFPVMKSILPDADWLALARDFFLQHRCKTPHFSEIAEEFLDYLQNERRNAADLPFLLELAHYEWVEMALAIARDQPEFGGEAFAEHVHDRALQLSPLAWPLVYRFQVQRIGPGFVPEQAPEQATYLIVNRDSNDEVRFMQTNAMTYLLLQTIEQQPNRPGAYYLDSLAARMAGQAAEEATRRFGLDTLQELARKDIVIPAVDV